MKPKWLIEDCAYPEDLESLYAALEKQGIEYKKMGQSVIHQFVKDKTFLNKNFGGDECVVFFGSLQMANIVRRNTTWIPGAYCDIRKFDCTQYYPVFGPHMLNENYMMLPYGELERRKEFIYDTFGSDRTIFIRPNVGDKVFTGKLIYKERFNEEIERFGFKQINPHELVIVANPVNLAAEWRFVVSDGEVIAGSLYKENNVVGSSPNCPPEAIDLASKMAKLYNPDKVWVVDICLTKSGFYKLLEIGCFSCAGLYACDRNKIVEKVSALALDEWEEYQNNRN